MKSEIFSDGQKPLSQNFNRVSSTKEEATKERTSDFFGAGVLTGVESEFAFSVNGGNNTKLDIGKGVAYDTLGERIIVNSLTTYDATNPSDTTDDGIGGFSPTPQSTGTVGIQMSSGFVNYIFIGYLQTVDPGTFSLHNVTGKRLFTKGEDGFEVIKVNSATIVSNPQTLNPDLADLRFVFLGYVDFRVGASINPGLFSITDKQIFSLKAKRDFVKNVNSSKSNRTTSYAVDQFVDLLDHVRAVGSGTPTDINPHAITASDLQLAGKTTEQHEKFLHPSSIVGSPTSTASALYALVNAVTPGTDQLLIKGFTSSELVLINGVTVDNTSLSGTITITWNPPSDTNANYTIFVDNVTKTIQKSLTSSYVASVDKFVIWTVDFTNAVETNLSNLIDKRVFSTDVFSLAERSSDASAPSSGAILFVRGDLAPKELRVVFANGIVKTVADNL